MGFTGARPAPGQKRTGVYFPQNIQPAMPQKKCTPDLLAAMRLINPEVPDNCTPSEAWKWVRPVTATGVTFPAWSFWGILAHKLLSAPSTGTDKTCYRHTLIAKWIHSKREQALKTGKPWPPVVVTQKPAFVPQPRTGKH